MKKLIVLFLLLPFFGNTQQVYLNCTKTEVESDMQVYDEFIQTVNAKNYIEYQRDSIAVGYCFKHNKCINSMITMPRTQSEKFLKAKIGIMWKPYLNGWIYDTNVYKKLVYVQEFEEDVIITFQYTFLKKKLYGNSQNSRFSKKVLPCPL